MHQSDIRYPMHQSDIRSLFQFMTATYVINQRNPATSSPLCDRWWCGKTEVAKIDEEDRPILSRFQTSEKERPMLSRLQTSEETDKYSQNFRPWRKTDRCSEDFRHRRKTDKYSQNFNYHRKTDRCSETETQMNPSNVDEFKAIKPGNVSPFYPSEESSEILSHGKNASKDKRRPTHILELLMPPFLGYFCNPCVEQRDPFGRTSEKWLCCHI